MCVCVYVCMYMCVCLYVGMYMSVCMYVQSSGTMSQNHKGEQIQQLCEKHVCSSPVLFFEADGKFRPGGQARMTYPRTLLRDTGFKSTMELSRCMANRKEWRSILRRTSGGFDWRLKTNTHLVDFYPLGFSMGSSYVNKILSVILYFSTFHGTLIILS